MADVRFWKAPAGKLMGSIGPGKMRMMRFRTIRLMVAAGIAALLSGCAVVLMGIAVEQDDRAKLFSPRDGKSLIYVYLDEPSMGISSNVILDGKIAGIIRPQTYLVSHVEPGPHTIKAGEGVTAANNLAFDTEPGGIYFIREQVFCEEGKPISYLYLVDEATGRERVTASYLGGITLSNIPLLNGTPASDCASGKNGAQPVGAG